MDLCRDRKFDYEAVQAIRMLSKADGPSCSYQMVIYLSHAHFGVDN